MRKKSIALVLLTLCGMLAVQPVSAVWAEDLSDGNGEDVIVSEIPQIDQGEIQDVQEYSDENIESDIIINNVGSTYNTILCPGQVDKISVNTVGDGKIKVECSSNAAHIVYTGYSLLQIGGYKRYSYGYEISFSEEGEYKISFVNTENGSTSEYIAKVEPHTFDNGTVVEASCESEGYTLYKCSRCEEILKKDVVPAKPHQWKDDYVIDRDVTCDQDGQKSIHCSVCNAIKEDSVTVIPALGHKWDEGTTIKEPTCTENGVKIYTCATCNVNKKELISAIGHKWNEEFTIDQNPTCTKAGSKSIHCNVCNMIKEDSITVIPENGHDFENVISKASFYSNGYIKEVCKTCGNVKSKTIIEHPSHMVISQNRYTYNGTNRKPLVTVYSLNGEEFSKDNYIVVYPDECKYPGNYRVDVVLQGDYYKGGDSKGYTIKKANQVISLDDQVKRIDSKAVTLKAQIIQGNKTGKFHYTSENPSVATVSGWGRVSFRGIGTVRIRATTKGTSNYNSASKTITVTVVPAPTAITKLQSQRKGWLNIQYRANRDADGYQIQYGTSENMSGAKYAAVNNSAIRSYTRKDVTPGATYYVRVRTYNVVNGTRYYSNWSGIKSITVK